MGAEPYSVGYPVRRNECPLNSMASLNLPCTWTISVARFVSIRRFLDSRLSATLVSAAARCTPARARYCCCLKRKLRARFHLRTMGTANCTSHSPFQPLNWPPGNHGSRSRELRWKKSAPGNRVAGAFIFAIPTDICSNLPRQVSGPSTEGAGAEQLLTACSEIAVHAILVTL